MLHAITEVNLPVEYSPRDRSFGIDYSDGGSVRLLAFCPFCGASLPTPLHREWFDRLDALGIDPGEDDIPLPFQTDQWWRDAGL